MASKVIRIIVPMRRSADLVEVRVVNDEVWNKIEQVIKSKINVYLGEVAGKHSEVSLAFEDNNIEILSEDQNDCEVLMRLVGGHVGLYMVDAMCEALSEQ